MLKQKNVSSKTKVELYLREKLRHSNPGDKLPSIRQLKSLLEVSQSVVDKAVMHLVIEGLLEVRQPTGLFKAEPVRPVIKLLNFQTATGIRSFYHEFLADLLYEIAQNGRRVELISDRKAIAKLMKSPGNDTIITFGVRLQEYSDLSHHIHRKIINLLPNFIDDVAPGLIIDDTELIEKQIRYLVDCGHRKITYLHLKDENSYIRAQNARWDTFHRLGFELGLEFDKDFLINCVDRDLERIAGALFELLQKDNRPDAVLLGSDVLVQGAYEGIKRAGMIPGEDISVLGTDNRAWCEFTSPALCSAGFDYRMGFKKLISMIHEVENGADGELIKLPVKIFERKSTVNK